VTTNTPILHPLWDSTTLADVALVMSPHQRHGLWRPAGNTIYVAAVPPTGSGSQDICGKTIGERIQVAGAKSVDVA